ncbi:MAG: preprotein translocase subunit YajC [Dermatophilaceae bacterium]
MHTGLATATQSGSGMGSVLLLLLPLVLLFVLMFSQRRRTQALKTVQASIGVGDEVVTTSGMIGRVAALDGQVTTLEVAPGVRVRFDRRAIGSRYQPAPPTGPLDQTGPVDQGSN